MRKKIGSFLTPGNLLVILIPVILILVVFRKFFLQGMIPMPGDILIGGYYPWLDSKWGFPVSVPVKNNLPSDVFSIMYPWRIMAMNQLKAGILPLWDNSILLGVPLLANFQASVFNPLNILFFLFSSPYAWGIQVVCQPLLMWWGTYLFLREIGLSKTAAVFGGLFYAFSGFSLVWLEYNSINYTLAFFPLILLTLERLAKKPQLVDSFLLSLFLCLQIFSGYPLSVFFSLLFAGLYFSYRLFWQRKKLTIKLGLALLGVVLGFSLAAIQLLPGLELSGLSIRGLDKSAVAGDIKYLPFDHLVSFFIPDFFGNPGTMNYWGIGSYDNFAFFLPAVGVFFLVVAIVSKQIFKKENFVFLLLFILPLIYATQNPVSVALKTNFFSLDASVNARILFVTTLAASVMAAFGLERYLKNKTSFLEKVTPFLVYGLIVGMVIISQKYIGDQRASVNQIFAGEPLDVPEIAKHEARFISGELNKVLESLEITFRNTAIPSAIVLGTTLLIFLKNKKLALLGFTLLTFYSVKVSWDKYLSFTQADLIYPTMPAIEQLKNLVGDNRFDRERAELMPPNSWSVYGLKAASGQDSLALLSTARYFNLINTESQKDEILTRFIELDKTDTPLYDTLNIEYFVALNRDVKESVPSKAGRPFPWIIPEKFEDVANIDTLRIYKNTKNLGVSWIPEAVVCEGEVAKVSEQLIDPNYNPAKLVFVDCDTPQTYRIFSQANYPGWQAIVDGQSAEIKTANIALTAVPIENENQKVKLAYHPQSVKTGALVSLASLSAWGVIFGLSRAGKLRLGDG